MFPGLGELKRSYQRLGDPPRRDIFLKGLDLPSADQVTQSLVNPYGQHVQVFTCVRTIYTTFSQAPFRLYRSESDIPVMGGPINTILSNPSPFMSGNELWQYTVMFLELTGNALWWLDNDGVRNRIPRNILVFNPRYFHPVRDPRTGLLVGYRLRTGGARANSQQDIFLTTDEVVHFRYPNPENSYWGIGPLQVARLAAEQDFKADLYNSAFFENSAEPGGLLLYKGENELTEDQKNDIVMGWQEQHGGVHRAFRLGVLPGQDWDYKQLGLTHRDMQFMEQQLQHDRDIAKVFGVPPLFVGDYYRSGISDAGLKVQYRLLWDTNLIPKGLMIQDKCTKEFITRYDATLSGEFDTDKIPAIKEDFGQKLANAKTLMVDMQVPFNMVNEQLALGFPPTPWGDDAYVNANMVPISQLGEILSKKAMAADALAAIAAEKAAATDTQGNQGGPDTSVAIDSGKGKGSGAASTSTAATALPGPMRQLTSRRAERALDVYWRSFVQMYAPIERTYQNRLRRFFFDIRIQVLSDLMKVYGARAAAGEFSRAFGIGEIASVIVGWYDKAKAQIRVLSAPFFAAAYKSGGLSLLGEVGQSDSLFIDSADARHFLAQKEIKIVGIVDTVKEQVRDELTAAFANNEGLTEASDRIRGVFNAAANRARTIARTEIGQSISGGRYEGFVQSGVARGMWLSARDTHVRHAHAPGTGVDGEVRDIGEPFSNGLLYPLDPNGPPEQVINCFLPGTKVSGRFVAGLKAHYSGPAREIITARGHRLRVTANHPIFTPTGISPAILLREGDNLFAYSGDINLSSVDEDDGQVTVEEVFETLRRHVGSPSIVQARPMDFHSDGWLMDKNIDIVAPLGFLLRDGESLVANESGQLSLIFSHTTGDIRMHAREAKQSLCQRDANPFQPLSFGLAAKMDLVMPQDATNDNPVNVKSPCDMVLTFPSPIADDDGGLVQFPVPDATEVRHSRRMQGTEQAGLGYISFLRKILKRYSSEIALDRIVEIRDFYFSGHVYDLQSLTGYIVAGNLLCRQCRCVLTPVNE